MDLSRLCLAVFQLAFPDGEMFGFVPYFVETDESLKISHVYELPISRVR